MSGSRDITHRVPSIEEFLRRPLSKRSKEDRVKPAHQTWEEASAEVLRRNAEIRAASARQQAEFGLDPHGKLLERYGVKVNGTMLWQSSKEHAMKKAKGVSTLPSKAATQIAVYQGSVANHKVVAVYLNGNKLPKSAWFVGFKR